MTHEIKHIHRWQTLFDGRVHDSREAAERWDAWLLRLADANAQWEGGATLEELAPILKEHCGSIPPEIAAFDRHTMLRIPHWQCYDSPAYSIWSFSADGRAWVGGAPPDFFGKPRQYGNHVTLIEIARFAANGTARRAPE